MGCRIGMETDVDERIEELIEQRLVPKTTECTIIESELTYDEANQLEIESLDDCGSECDGHPGGRGVLGPVWSVYRLDW